MTVPAQTVQTFAMVGIREDLSDAISNIDPTETPLYSRFKKGKCDNRTPEWQIDTRRDANANNKVVEGSDATNKAVTPTTRLKNVVQLFEGTVQVSTTANAVKTAGRANEMDYQVAKEGEALKRYFQFLPNWSGIWVTTTSASISGGLPVEMRVSPTATLISGTNAVLDPQVAFRNASAITAAVVGPAGGYVYLTTATGVAGKGCWWTNNGVITLSARL